MDRKWVKQIKIIIDISEKDYEDWCTEGRFIDSNDRLVARVRKSINNGMLLSKYKKDVIKPYLDKLKEKIHKYQSIHDSCCDYVSNSDIWKSHTKDRYEASSEKATACEDILKFIDELIESNKE